MPGLGAAHAVGAEARGREGRRGDPAGRGVGRVVGQIEADRRDGGHLEVVGVEVEAVGPGPRPV